MPPVTDRRQDGQREELLEVAWRVASRDGLAACTYRRVAAEAGTSTTPLVHHFPSRGELLLALLGRLSRGFDEAREQAVASAAPVAAIVEEGAGVLSAGPQSAGRRRLSVDLAFEGLRDPAVRRRLRDREAERVERWMGLVAAGQGNGTVRTDRPAGEIVDELGSFLDGLALGTLMYPARLPPAHVARLWAQGVQRLVDPGLEPVGAAGLPGAAEPVAPEPGPRARLLGDPELTRRQELLEVAFRVTSRDGLAGLSFRTLADEAGTSTTPFTYTFGNREGLLAEMVRAIWVGSLDVREAASRVADPVERFFAEWRPEFSDDAGQLARERAYYELHHAALADAPLSALMREGDEDGFSATLVLVETGQEQGRVRGDVPAGDLVDSLYALADGIGLRRVLLREKRPAGYRTALWEDAGRRILAP